MSDNVTTIPGVARFFAHLKNRNLDEQAIRLLGLEYWARGKAQNVLGYDPGHDAIGIPYWDADGAPLFDDESRSDKGQFVRLRLLGKEGSGKYLQQRHTKSHAYLTRCKISWKLVGSDPKQVVIFTEGEFKAAAANLVGGWPPVVAFSGVDNWSGRKHGLPIVPELLNWDFKDRHCFICYDNDITSKPEVKAAAARLAGNLIGFGARVTMLHFPSPTECGLNYMPGMKMGIDDFIKIGGTFAMMKQDEITESSDLSRMLAEYGVLEGTVQIVRFEDGMTWDINKWHALVSNRFTQSADKDARTVTSRLFMASDKRTIIHHLDVLPDQDFGLVVDADGKKVMNMWRGWAHEPVAEHWEERTEAYREFVHAFFSAEPDLEDLWWKWCAYWIQNPGRKSITGWVIISPEQGIGKSLLGETIGRMVGRPAFAQLGPRDLGSEWTDWVENCMFVVCNEPGDSDYKHVKDLRTADTLRINIKYGRKYVVRNMLNMVVTTNELTPYRIDIGSRRDIIYRPPYTARSEWTDWLADVTPEMMGERFYSALMWYLTNEIDLVGYNPTEPAPITSASEAIYEAGQSPTMTLASDINAALKAANMDVAFITNKAIESMARRFEQKPEAFKKHLRHAWAWSDSSVIKLDGRPERGLALAKAKWYWDEVNKAEIAMKTLEIFRTFLS